MQEDADYVAVTVEQTRVRPLPWTQSDLFRSIVLVILVVLVGIAVLLMLRPFVEPGSRAANMLGLFLSGVIEMAMLVALWLFAFNRQTFDWFRLGFRPVSWLTLFVSAGVTLVIAFAGLAVYESAIRASHLTNLEPPSVPVAFARDPVTLFMLAILAVVVAPLVEESFFRGFAFPALRSQWGSGPAALGSALLFGTAHLSFSSVGLFVPTAFLGLLLVYLYIRTGSLWSSVMVHASFNAINILFLAMSA